MRIRRMRIVLPAGGPAAAVHAARAIARETALGLAGSAAPSRLGVTLSAGEAARPTALLAGDVARRLSAQAAGKG